MTPRVVTLQNKVRQWVRSSSGCVFPGQAAHIHIDNLMSEAWTATSMSRLLKQSIEAFEFTIEFLNEDSNRLLPELLVPVLIDDECYETRRLTSLNDLESVLDMLSPPSIYIIDRVVQVVKPVTSARVVRTLELQMVSDKAARPGTYTYLCGESENRLANSGEMSWSVIADYYPKSLVLGEDWKREATLF